MLEVSHLSKVFVSGKNKAKAVDDVSFVVNRGEIVGLLGPNGAGKTTTIKSVLGITRPSAGSIKVGGFDPFAEPSKALSLVAAVLEGSRNIYWRMTTWENIVFFAGIHGVSHKIEKNYFDHLIETFKLVDKRSTEVRQLSQGMKQKVAICCALVKKTPLVFLDEPTVGLDIETSYELRGILKELAATEARTMVVSSHDMAVIQDICQRVIIMSGGRVIADDKIDDLLAVFRSRNYKIAIGKVLDNDVVEHLRKRFNDVEVQLRERKTNITINLPSAGDLYALMDFLREHNIDLETINQQDPDLEKAFVALVRKERERCNGNS
ncbi:MAG: ABC transporter ATP-binding protein NatA [Firmicutes bacterium]|nr:ABC transporter ATP-binding protein NatA [Bacillota bacterium]